LAVVTVMTAACGGANETPRPGSGDPSVPSSFNTPFADDEVYPVFVSSEIAVGRNRFLVGLLNDNDAPIGSPAIEMDVTFYELERSAREPVGQTGMRWVWIDKPYVGLYAADVTFDRAGLWGAEVRVTGPRLDATVRSNFEVRRSSSTPALGERVPASKTPTASTRPGIRRISTDDDPTPRFYSTSIAEALRANDPFVVVFATPKFCATQTCGPMLDTVESVANQRRDVTFIHVEPYELPADPAGLQPVDAAIEWGLPSEPWTFFVGSDGSMAAKFEGAVSAAELRAALRRLR
jgi:hypothetical protein